MATWRDGPRYAPVERPQAFAEPASGISLLPPATTPLPPEPPVTPPETYEATDGIPLDHVNSPVAPNRDPSQAFSVIASALTSAASTVHGDRDPAQPFAIVASIPMSAKTPDAQTLNAKPSFGFAPPTRPPAVAKQPRSVAVKDLFSAAYIPLLIILGVGVLLKELSVLCLIGAAILPAMNVTYRGRQLRIVGLAFLGVVLAGWGVIWLINQGINNVGFDISVVAQTLCLVYLFVNLVFQYIGLRNGDKPDPKR